MKIDIKHIAELANLNLTEDEAKKFEKQLSDIVSYVDKLNELNTTQLEPTSQVTGLLNVLREDETARSITQDEALSNAAATHNGMFVVKQILEEK